MKEYELYAESRGGPFTTKSIQYSRGTHRIIYAVRAVSVKQAYYFAGVGFTWAPDSRGLGVLSISGKNEPELAPYLRETQTNTQTAKSKSS